ncbi:MAG TPA: hypothetical protein VKU82_04610, partial [Planctomycetaceae bacterium]|nr:hypothetical protein [Planctomycetaceae bacterium]
IRPRAGGNSGVRQTGAPGQEGAPQHDASNRAAPAGEIPDWAQNAAAEAGLPDWRDPVRAPARPGEIPSEAGPRRPAQAWRDVQATAAQLGLSAGPAGTIFSLGDWAVAASREAPMSAGPAASHAAGLGGQMPLPAGSEQQGPSPANRPAPAASSDLPPWPGRPSLPPPAPTEVVPMGPAYDPGR